MLWHEIELAISQATQDRFSIHSRTGIDGGCINSAWKVSDGKRHFFVKTNHTYLVDMFEAEMAGLEEIHASKTICCPKPITYGVTAESAYLVLEYMDMQAQYIDDRLLGQQLAAMHQVFNSKFGWLRNNTIGSTPQQNTPSLDWADFWRQHRLGYQLKLAAKNGFTGRLQHNGEKLLESVHLFFSAYQPKPALVHGDLWSGNYSSLRDGSPVIFDPAVYYGDRETDLAMTELFGGFSPRFYAAYREAAPLEAGYQVRKTLYNLYHMLNHLNLFSGGYLSQAESMVNSLLAEIK